LFLFFCLLLAFLYSSICTCSFLFAFVWLPQERPQFFPLVGCHYAVFLHAVYGSILDPVGCEYERLQALHKADLVADPAHTSVKSRNKWNSQQLSVSC
jgi:hypothetical protein